MSFSDMMSSSRGPGVIGTLIALAVLAGFGILFVFAFDEGLQGGEQSIESVLKYQAEEIESQRAAIATTKEKLVDVPARLKTEEELKDATRELAIAANQVANLTETVAKVEEQIQGKLAEFEAYKDDYRAFARRQAVGEKLDELKTVEGTIFKGVEIREVDAVGILIRHTDGQQRVPFEVLSAEIQDRFQFDPVQKESAIVAEAARREAMERAAAAAEAAAGEMQEVEREKERERVRQETRRTIAAKEQQLAAAKAALTTLERDKAAAEQAAAAARAAGRQHINRSGSIARSIASKQNEIRALTAEIARLKANN
jgi:hypothetical protein